MKLKMIVGVMIILMLMSMLTVALNVPPILADAGTAEHPDDNSTIQKTDGDKQSNLTASHESFVSESLNWNASAKENPNLYSVDETGWNFNKINEWADFAKVDDDSAELVIGVNNEKPNSHEDIKGLIDENGGDLVGTVSMGDSIKAIVAEIPLPMIPHFATEVQAAGLSRYIEPNRKFQTCFIPNDSYWSYQWGPRKIEADYAWNTTTGDPSVLVAVIDTGTDYDHPDLAANYVPLGYDWVNYDPDPMDDNGHGTHCAGIIAAVINNGIGIAGLAQVQIMAEKGLDTEGWGTEDDLANAIIHAVDQGADILSNSWGSYGESALIYEAVEYAYDHGVLVVAAAGNDATSTEHFPAAFDEVIAVTATDEYDNPAWFPGWWGTNFGDWVELAAPGVDIYSTVWDDSYAYKSGTSMATPHVAGVAALILSQFPSMTRDQVRLQLRFTADDLGNPGFDDYYGYGRINAQKAVEQAPPDHDLLILDWETPLFVEPGGLTIVNTTVFNFGTSNETNIEVQLFVNGSIVDSATIGFLETATSETVNCSWIPTVEGTYNLTSYVVPVLDETFTANNFVTAMVDVGYFKYILFDQTHWTDSIVMYDTWANTLSERGYVVDVHTSGPITPTVLADYVAFVIPQAWDPYSLEELLAIQNFVIAGGGLLVIGDDEPSVYTDLTAFAGISWVGGGCSGITTDVMPHEVTQGVTSVYLDAPIAEMVVSGCAQDLVRDPMGGIMLAVSEQPGRVIGFADEDSLWDYSITQEDNLLLANNMIDWLVFQPEHDLAVILDTPPYVEPGDSSLLNVTVRNRGLSNETDVKLFLFINGTIVKNETAPEMVSDSSYTMDYLWTPAGEKVMYNVTGYAVPVENETVTANNLESAYVYIGVPVKAFVLDSAGTDNSGIISTWQLLTTNWYMFGEKMTTIDYTTLNIEDLTYEDLATTDADVLIISCASDQYQGWEFTDSEIEAIDQYVQEGHGLIATSGTFYEMVPNNNKLAPLFGLNETITWHQSYTDLLQIQDPTHPLFNNVPNPYTFLEVYTAFPSDGQLDSNELAGGEYVALGHFQESAIVVYKGLVYISPLLEYGIPPYYHHHLQLLYNAITWSSYQKPEHELVVSLEAPTHLEPGESTLLNATVSNFGLNNETNVELFLLINGTKEANATIPLLEPRESYTINCPWTPTVEATYNVTAYAPPVTGENITMNNIATKMVHVRSVIGYVVFEEAHLPSYTVGSNPAADVPGGYSEFANYLAINGYMVSTIDPGTIIDAGVLAPVDVLVIVAPQNSYSTSELDAIENWVKSGGKLLLISDWIDFGLQARAVAARFNINLRGDGICDSDENIGPPLQPYYDGANLLIHPITTGVTRVEMYASDGVASAPTDEIPLIVTDSDGTAYWYSDSSPALSVSVMNAFDGSTAGSGRLIIITDSNIWDSAYDVDGDGDVGFYDSDNEILALKSVEWLAVTYEHDLAVSLDAPTFLEPGDSSLLNATVHNRGLSNETDVELFLLINGTAVNYTTIPELLTGAFYTINYSWSPTVEATYNVTAYAPPVPGENVTANNIITEMVDVRALPDILIVDDNDGSSWITGTSLLEFESALMVLGYDYWVWNESAMGKPPLDFLTKFKLVIWTCGDYWNKAVDPTDALTLESYLAQGGNILLEGEDIGYDHDADDFMINVAHAIMQIDHTGAPGLTVTDPTHPVTFGLPTSFTWLTNPPIDDGVSPTNGGTEVIKYTGTAWTAVTVFEGASSGSVVYYAFPLYCLAESHGESLAINSVNWLLGVRYEHELAVALEAPDYLEPGDSSLLNATVHNRGLSNETDVELFLLINGTKEANATIPLLEPGESHTINCSWTPTVEATYNVTAYAPPVPSENITANNVHSRYVIVSYAPKILAYVEYTDYYQEYANALGAIDSTFGPNYILTELWDYTQLDSMLPGNDILFIPEQENADLYTMESIGANWLITLSNFMAEGGIIIVCDHGGGSYGVLTGAELMSIFGVSYITGSTVYLVDPSDPLAEYVSDTFIAPNGALSFITAETNVVFNDGTYPVVIHKTIGPGHIALIGFDYYASNADADRILGNAVGLCMRPRIPGDINNDGIVNILDVLIAVAAFGSQPGDPKWNPDADLDGNGIINILDLVIIGVNFGKTG